MSKRIMNLFDDPYKQTTKANAEEESKPPLKPPPKTCDEWLTSSSGAGHLVSTDGTLFIPSTKDGVIKWPIHPPNLDYLVAAPPLPREENKVIKTTRKHETPEDTILGSLEEIKEDLREHAPWDPRMWNNVERKVQLLESKLNISADNFIDEERRPTRASLIDGVANISDLTFMTELSEELMSLRKQGTDNTATISKKKSTMREKGTGLGDSHGNSSHFQADLDIIAPSELFRKMTKSTGEDEQNAFLLGLGEEPLLMALPGKLDALAILDLVHNAADIPQCLMESWRRVFFCNESVAILQNAFWWLWLDYFKPKKWIQSLLFNQIADDFVSILNRMEGKYKDQIFLRYPVYLSQALYSAFCQAFPRSNKELNTPEFLDYLCNTISEWILGVQSQPNQWERWPRDVINPYFHTLHKEKERKEKTKTEDQKPSFTDKEVSNLTRHFSLSLNRRLSHSSSAGEPIDAGKHLLDFNKRFRQDSSSISSNPSLGQLEKGPVFECVRFNIHGRSPLLQHYLYHHNLTEFKQHPGLTICRTQIKEFPSHRYTYQQVIRAQRRRAQKLYQEYKSQMAQSEHDIAMDRSKYKPPKQALNPLEQLRQARKLTGHNR